MPAPRRIVNLQVVAVREGGTSEILPLSPDTLRVFLILRGPADAGKPIPEAPGRPVADAAWSTIRRSVRGVIGPG